MVRHTLPDAESDNEELEIIEPEIPELLLDGLSPDKVSQRIEGLVDALEEKVE